MAEPGVYVSLEFQGKSFTAKANLTAWWTVALSTQPATTEPTDISITTSAGEAMILADIVFGDVFFCSGQSNMQLAVMQTENGPEVADNSTEWSEVLRSVYVMNDDSYFNTTEPQIDFIPHFEWARMSSTSARPFSAVCYHHAVKLLEASRDVGAIVPIGMLGSYWGGTGITSWMSPDAIAQCSPQKKLTKKKNPDPGLGYFGKSGRSKLQSSEDDCEVPCVDSTLYNSMVSPFTYLPVAGWLWYQGESNTGYAEEYACLFPVLINSWRAIWNVNTGGAQGAIPKQPFVFVQISSWPNNDDNFQIPLLRESQEAALALDDVAMVVAADVGDPGSACHPIHPPFKQEVARRMAIQTQRIQLQGDVSGVPASGPRPVQVTMDVWDESWGDFHEGYGSGGWTVCASGYLCFGVRVTFDQPLVLRDTYGLKYGFGEGGFEVLSDLDSNDGDRQIAAFTGVLADTFTVQLNVTWTFESEPVALRYAWKDYPNMPLTNSPPYSLPAPPFRIALQ